MVAVILAQPVCVVVSDGGLQETIETVTERPDDCGCGDWNDGRESPCWPCFQAGFDEPNPDATGDDNGVT